MSDLLFDRRARLTVSLPGDLVRRAQGDLSAAAGIADAAAAAAQAGQVPALVIEQLRVVFKITKTLKKHPNLAEISVYNLNEDHRSRMQSVGSRVILEVGYANAVGPVFVGDAHTIDPTVIEGPDIITKIQAGDSLRVYRFARVNESFAAGTRAGDIVSRCVAAMGIPAGNLAGVRAELDASAVYTAGFVAHGPASRVLDVVLRKAGFEYSIQNGELQIIRPGGLVSGVEVLSPDTGLVGSPVHGTHEHKGKPPMLKVKCLLRWSFRPGARVKVESKRVRGVYRIVKLEQTGDTEDHDWYSEMDCEPAA